MNNKTTLAEYAQVQGGYAYKSTDFNSKGTNKVLKIKNVRFGNIDYQDTSLISSDLAEKTSDWKVKPNDILISMTGSGFNAPASLVGRVARVRRNEPVAYINQRVGRLIISDKIHPDFIYYWLSQNSSQYYFVSNATGSANQVNINSSTILSIDIPKISYERSKRIAEILNSLDDKIQLNTETNQTLENIAQAIFKSWFIDFDPVHTKANALANGDNIQTANRKAMMTLSGKTEAELTEMAQQSPTEYAQLHQTAQAFPSEFGENGLPLGWEVIKASDFINVTDYVANGSFASLKQNVTLLDEPNYALYVRTTDYNSNFSKALKYVNKQSYDFLKKSSLNGSEIIISNVGDVGTIFLPPVWLNMPMTLGSNAIAIKNEQMQYFLYFYFKSHIGQHLLDGITTGSAQLKFNKTSFRALKILKPSENIISIFEESIKLIFKEIHLKHKESRKLEQIRDTLLPKLLNGEIKL